MNQRNNSRGFSLLEVMVALIIIAVGMLGIAKMQGLALSSTTASRSRALAAIEASSLAAAMQANRTFWSTASSTPGNIQVTTSGGTATVASDNGTMQSALTSAAGTLCPTTLGANLSCLCVNGNSAPCTGSNGINLAAADIYDFAWSMASFLPTSLTAISCNSANTPIDCTIHITWNENTVAMTTQQATQSYNAGSTVPVTFDLNVVP